MDEYTFEDDQPTIQFSDDGQKPVPPQPVVETRAAKAHYALGPDSPGVDSIRESIFNGAEGDLRQQSSFNEDMKYEQAKMDIVTTIAQKSGRDLTPEEAQVVYGLTKAEVRNDPGSILEKKFADKYISDVLGMTNVYGGDRDGDLRVAKADEANVAANVLHSKEFFQTRLEDLQNEWSQQGFLSSAGDFVGQLVPFLPWWRQAQALQERKTDMSFLMGSTIRENVQYLYSLPLSERKAQYEAAITYLKSKNTLDALTFAQAMVAYPTSDEYLANTVAMADYGTAGSFAVKLAGRLFRGAKAVTEVAKAAEAVDATAGLAPAKTALPAERPPIIPEMKQLDLFGEQPNQGSFRFMAPEMGAKDVRAPLQESKLPPGRLRGQHTTDFANYGEFDLAAGTRNVPENGLFRDELGKIRRSSNAYKQGELDLGRPLHQGSFDFVPPAIQKMAQEAIEAPASVKALRHGLADAVKATEGHKPPDVQEVLGAVGNIEQAGLFGALKRILNPLREGNIELAREVPSFANPGGFLADSKVVSRSRAQSLTPHLIREGERLVNGFVDLARVGRLPPEALEIAKANAEAALRKEYSGRLQSAIHDVIYTPADTPGARNAGGVDYLSLKVGKTDGTLFDSADQAAFHRSEVFGLGEKEAIVRQQGFKYYLEIPKHIDETEESVRNALVTPKNSANGGIINMLLNRVRSASDLVGDYQRGIRNLTTHAPQEIRKEIRDFIKDNIESLPKASRRALEDILRDNRDMPSVKYPGERGRWYDTAGEFEQAFVERHRRMPTEKEILGYDAFKRLSDFDWLLRNVAVYRDKARQSIEGFRFTHDSGVSPWFEGKRLDKMPWKLGNADQDAGVYIYNTESKTGKFHYKFNMSDEERALVDELINSKGYRVVQLFDAKTHPLAGIAKTAAGTDLKDQVHYVITNSWEKAPLSWKQVDYRPGGHVIYPNKWFVSQPQIQTGRSGKATYLGDTNALNFETEAQAKKFAERMDYGRQLLKFGRLDELDSYLAKNLPYNQKEFLQLFVRSDSPFSLDHKITYKQSGKNTISTDAHLKAEYDNGNLIDSTRNVHDLSNFMDKSYLADRDNVLSTIMENGTSMKLGPAEQLDPYSALNRAMGQGLRNIWMTDYKISAVESWVKEFQHVMQPNDKTLLAHPLFFLYNPQWKSVSEAAYADLQAAKAAQRAIVNFLGTRSELGGALDTIKMKVLNTVYEQAGQGKLLDIALATTASPTDFLRGVAFHSKLGMFNPVQFFVQAQSMAHSIAVAGVTHGLPGMAAAPLIRALGHNPAQLDAIAGVASKLGWSKEMFKEMYETLQKTGLYQVAGEAALRDDAFDPHLFRSTLGKLLFDAGPMFFNEGERMTRMTAFATAFREFRTANKAVKIGDREIAKIMTRADDLSVNMTRASNAAWQTGVLSVPTQFFAYNARVMEQLLGGRLTGIEKARVLAVYSAMYGVPIGAGAGVGAVYPVYDSVKQEAMKRGINLNEGFLKVLTEGLNAQVIEWVTGKQTNVAQRYGPGNNNTIKDILDGDKGIMDAVLGASGTILSDFASTLRPAFYAAASIVTDNGEYPVMAEDWMNFFRNISTLDVATKAYAASKYGQWLTKSNTVVTSKGVDTMDAALSILGLTPRSVSDTFLRLKANRSETEGQTPFERQAMTDYRAGLRAGSLGDYAGMRSYFIRANTALNAGDFNTAEKARIFQRMTSQNRDLQDKVKWDSVKNARGSRYKDIFDEYFNSRKK